MVDDNIHFNPLSLRTGMDVSIALGIVGVLMIMIIPLPTSVLDIMLSLNITVAILTLLVTIYAVKPLDFSVFPSLLLLSTLFRLSLNIASTRLILLNGHSGSLAAGKVISSFGSFVVGGNAAVGLVIFIILAPSPTLAQGWSPYAPRGYPGWG